ncbi:MAG: YeaH/YhbH family protein [Gammaproteobacteria bacterium]
MTQVIDRRLSGKNKSAINRQRFIRRFKSQIKKAVSDAVSQRSITDMDKGEKVNIPTRDTSEPVFHHGPGGRRQIIHPGNTDFVAGDKVPRPQGGGGGKGSGKASNKGEGEDEFVFQLTREEFLEFFFEDLELPDLVKTQLKSVVEYKSRRAGYTTAGIPSNINVIRSLRGALARRMALSAPYARELKQKEEELDDILTAHGEDDPKVLLLREEIKLLKTKINAVPFIDEFDIRYNNRVKDPVPSTQAVMFCIMDVSGSMNEERKDIAKRFFILLYLFLERNYESIDVVFIRHHTTAKEVDEEEFFYSRETGGTVVSSALELMHEIIEERYPTSQWNIYAAQASDGDNWEGDSPACSEILVNKIMPCLQYFAYVEITAYEHQSLWYEYEKVKANYPNFAMQDIAGLTSIYPIFRELFSKQQTQ